jgi:hypothetical protein
MNRLILKSTSLAQWYNLVNEAEDFFGKHLETDLESYLVHLLQRFTNKPELAASILALEYLDSLEASGQLRAGKLRDVGDKCLLFSGFFPELANKRNVTLSYFIQLGQRAYDYLALLHNQGLMTAKLYALLREQYITLVDVLFSIRELSGNSQSLSLIQAEDLWRNTGSEYAFKVLKNKKKIALKENHFKSVH